MSNTKLICFLLNKKCLDSGIPSIITELDTCFQGGEIDHSDEYNWQGEPFETRQGNCGSDRTKREVVRVESRRDSPQKGLIVIVKNVAVLDNYLVGPARSPFRNPHNNYIIIVRLIDAAWQNTSNRVLRKLWLHYGIVNVLLMAPCAESGTNQFATFYPFNIDTSIVNATADDYGAVSWTNITDTQISSELLKKLGKMNGYPFRVSFFPRYPTALQPKQMSEVSRRSYFNRAMHLSGGFGGFDATILGNLAWKMDFRTIVVRPSVSDFGYVDANGSVFGEISFRIGFNWSATYCIYLRLTGRCSVPQGHAVNERPLHIRLRHDGDRLFVSGQL